MNAKTFLQQVRKIDRLIENKLAERDQWYLLATGTVAPMGGERVQTSGSKQKMADAVGKYVDIESEIREEISRLMQKKKEIIEVIEQLKTVEYDVLHKLYVQNKTLNDVADAYDKTYSWATTVHGTALQNVQKIIDEKGQK